MHAQGPATLLDKRVALRDKRDEMEGRVSARPRLAIPKPGENAVRLLGEGGTWWLVVVPRDGGGVNSPALKKVVKHAHDLLMKEVDVV